MKWTRLFPESNPSVPRARRFVAESLQAVPEEVCETAALLVSELATNAVVHAATEFKVTVIFPMPTGRVRIEVADHDRVEPAPLHPPPNAPHGRGLFLVDRLAHSWGVQPASTGVGKTVWFELALVGDVAPVAETAPARRRWFRPGLSAMRDVPHRMVTGRFA
jgi:anti-sigma regulatory factor (Ser/Thr protein kinase)